MAVQWTITESGMVRKAKAVGFKPVKDGRKFMRIGHTGCESMGIVFEKVDNESQIRVLACQCGFRAGKARPIK